jgi:radical SAM superfamily enzyme YgiQ (UPF0313 family)
LSTASEPRGAIWPVTESRSLVIHAQSGCSYGKCSYCPQFGEAGTGRFDIREFERYVESEAGRFAPADITSIFLAEGNLVGMENKTLLAILKTLYRHFSYLRGVSGYGSAYNILRYREKHLAKLRRQGLTRLHVGFESGCDEVLGNLNKGVGAVELVDASRRVKKVGIELFLHVLISAGGRDLSEKHVAKTAEAINAVTPHAVSFQTLVPIPGTPLYTQVKEGRFQLLTPHEAIREAMLLIESVTVNTAVNCEHFSNYCHIMGRLPEDKARLLQELDYCLTLDESRYRGSGVVGFELPG